MRGDKIIVFSDNIFALREYAQRLRRPFIFGGTSHAERTRVLAAFKRNPEVLHAPPQAFAFLAYYGRSTVSSKVSWCCPLSAVLTGLLALLRLLAKL